MSNAFVSAVSALADPQALATLQPVAPGAMPAAAGAPAGIDRFGSLVSQGIEQVNGGLVAAQVDMQQLATGNSTDLHRIMIHLEQSQLSFQLMMQVRNRLLDAYQDVMKMQV